MKTVLAITSFLMIPALASASPSQRLEVGIAELSCVSTNGVSLQLVAPSQGVEAAKVRATLGFVSKYFGGYLEQTRAGQLSLALDAAGLSYKVPANIDPGSTEVQTFSGALTRYMNAPITAPVSFITCRIRLQ